MKQYAVGFFKNSKGDVLLLRRSWSAPWMDYKWSLPGGTVEPFETPLDAFIREVKEEMSIDITYGECFLRLIVKEKEGDCEIFYYDVESSKFNEEDIILNFENDKYRFINVQTEITEVDLIPNLDVVLEYLRDSGSELHKQQVGVDNLTIQKSFIGLIEPNPFELDLEKGKLETGKLHLKDIVDKLGRHIKKWVKGDEPTKDKKEAKVDNQTQDKTDKVEPEEFDYHSIYQDDNVVSNHAKNTESEQLKSFIKKEGNNKKATKLVEAAKKELKSRGELVEAHDKNPFSKEDKKPEPVQQKVKGEQTPETSEQYEKRTGKKLEETPENKTKEEKPKVQEHVKELIKEGKTFEQKPESPEKDIEESKHNEEADKVAEKVVKEEKKKYDPTSDKKAIKTKEGHYNPETLEGWDGDNSIEENSKKTADQMDDHLKKVVGNIIDSNKSGDLEIVEGDGGLGKTFEVLQQMKAKGLKEASMDDKSSRGEKSKGKFVHLKGDISPAKFYEVIHDYPYSKIIVDDVGKILKDPQGLEMLKAATDTSSNTVTRGRSGGSGDESKREKIQVDLDDAKEELESLKDKRGNVHPRDESKAKKIQSKIKKLQIDSDALGEKRANQVEFKGQMLIISNRLPTDNEKLKEEFYDPLVTRTKSGKINTLRMDNDAKLYKLSKLIPHFSGRKDSDTGEPTKLSGQDRKMTYDYIKKLTNDDKVEDISMRMMGSVSDQIQDLKRKGVSEKDITKELDKLYYADKDEIKKALSLSPEMIQHFENLILGI